MALLGDRPGRRSGQHDDAVGLVLQHVDQRGVEVLPWQAGEEQHAVAVALRGLGEGFDDVQQQRIGKRAGDECEQVGLARDQTACK